MFDSLLGRRFSSKCKSSIKDIRERLAPQKNRKAAQVKFLKKDVADLISRGQDNDAFVRAEVLLTEMNKLSCYEMIEQSCNGILKQLSCLQKQRECPPESMEDVSTLIYAAARFPDLPELCNLRRVFTERHGSSVESYVNAEFIEKMGKSASMNKKLQLMRDISEEFSIQWDSRAFEFKMSNPGVQASDRPRKGGSLHSVNNETTIKKGDHEIPSQGGFDLSPKSTTKKEYVTIKRRDIKIESRDIKVESRDIHIVSSTMNDIRKDPSKTTTKAFEKENPKPNSTDNLVPPPIKNRNSKIGPHAEDVRTKCIDPSSNAGAGYRHQNTQMGSERVIQEERVDEKAKPNVSSYRNIPPHYVKPNGVSKQVGADQNKPADEHKPERAQEKSDDIERGKEERKLGGEDLSKPKPRSVRRRNPRVIHIEEEDSAKIEGGRRRHPPTSVPTLDDDLGRPTYDEDRVVVGDQDVSGRRRHTPRSVPTLNDDLGRPTYDDDIVVVDDQHAIGGRTHNTRRRASSYTNDRERVESHGEEKVMDTRNTSGRRRRGMRHGFPTFDDERDNEDEMIMDNLLIHYSKKGLSDKSYTPRPPRAKPPKLHVNKGGDLPPCRDDGIQLAVEVGHPPVRAVSLPPTSDSPKEAAKVPVRAASLQPDLLSPMGKHVHPKLPDYDELAARFNALKKM